MTSRLVHGMLVGNELCVLSVNAVVCMQQSLNM